MTVEVDATGISGRDSSLYTATIDGGAAFVYGFTRAAKFQTSYWANGASVEAHWLTWGADTDSTLVISMVSGTVTSFECYPENVGAVPTIVGGTLSVVVPSNRRLWIEINGDRANGICVHGQPLKSALPSPRTDYTTLAQTVTLTTGGSGTVTSERHGYVVDDVVTLHAATTMPTATTGDLTAYEVLTVATVPDADRLTLKDADDVAVTFANIGAGAITLHPAKWTNTSTALYFPAGEHKLARLFSPSANTELYFDRGSVTTGSFDHRGKDGIVLRGPGMWSGEYGDPATVNAAGTQYVNSFVYGEDGAKFVWDNTIAEVTMFAPCGWFNRGGLSSWRNVLTINPWYWGLYSIYVAAKSWSEPLASVNDCMVYNADDAFGYAHEYRNVAIDNCFAVNTLNACFQNRYWPLAPDTDNWATITDCHAVHLGLVDSGVKDGSIYPTYGGNSVIKSMIDGHDLEAEQQWGDYHTTFTNLHVWGPVASRLLTLGNHPYAYSIPLQRDQHGQLQDFNINGLTVQEVPGQISFIEGHSDGHAPNGVTITDWKMAGIAVTDNNVADYLSVGDHTRNINPRKHMAINIHDLNQPATKVRNFTPGTSDLPITVSGLVVSVAGNIEITDASGTTSVLLNVPVGVLPVAAVKVLAGSTTATVTTCFGH